MRKILLLLIMTATLSACVSIFLTTTDKVKNVQTGMTEKQVIGIMGGDYTLEGAHGNTRIISYPVHNTDWLYRFYFVDNRLESFERIQIYRPHNHSPQPGN